MSHEPTTEQYLMKRMENIAKQIEVTETLAEELFLGKVVEYSQRFPGFTVEVVGGNGALYVTVYDPHGVERREYHYCDPRPDDPDGYGFLFGWMVELEEKLGNYYANFPMVAPGIMKFKNGQKI